MLRMMVAVFLMSLFCIGCRINDNRLRGSYEEPTKAPTKAPPTLKLNCSTKPLQGFPYSCLAQLLNFDSSAVTIEYSLFNSTCSGLNVDSQGKVTGQLTLTETESCVYQLKASSDGMNATSEPITLTAQAPLTMSFGSKQIYLKKATGVKTVSLQLSKPSPYDIEVDYNIIGGSGANVLSGYSDAGQLQIAKGASELTLDFEVPSSSPLSGVEYLSFNLTPIAKNRPSLYIAAHSDSPPSFDYVVTGDTNTCALSGGKLFCWGADSYGQVGNGSASSDSVTVPTQIGASSNWSDIALGSNATCGIDAGRLFCWGANHAYQVGNGGPTTPVHEPVQIGGSSTWSKVDLGWQSSCGIDAGKLFCWGEDGVGQVGNGGANVDVPAPVQITGSTNWTDISLSFTHTCGIDNGSLYCWGMENYGFLGNGGGAFEMITSPVKIGSSTNWTHVSTGISNTCGIDGGKLFCWGSDDYGLLGDGLGITAPQVSPAQVGVATDWVDIEHGSYVVCGTRAGGTVYCWGAGLGLQTVYEPEELPIDGGWSQISTNTHLCGIDNSNQLHCWGHNSSGQLGNGQAAPLPIYTPKQTGQGTSWLQVSQGDRHSCGIGESGNLYCWGNDSYGQIGNGSLYSGTATNPNRVGVSQSWSWVTTGFSHSCGIDGGKLYCWGSDTKGQVGNGDENSSLVEQPEKIGLSNTWSQLSAGRFYTCGIDGGKLYCWGSDDSGKLGNGSSLTSDVTSPMQIGTSNTWTKITSGHGHSCGINSGALYCWGSDTSEIQGNGVATSGNVEEPTQVGLSFEWTDISAGAAMTCGINDGKLFCWGANDYGQVGNGIASGTPVDTPLQIGVSTSWSKVSLGEEHSCGLNDGKLFCWGSYTSGKTGLGTGLSAPVTTPTQVGSSQSWSSLELGDEAACAIKDHDLYCWGVNYDAQIRSFYSYSSSPLMVLEIN